MKRIGKGIDFAAKIRRLEKAKKAALRGVANNSVNFFKVTVFNAQGFVDGGVNRWAPVKQTKEADRKILVKTGHGRQSIHVVHIIHNRILIRAEAPYMKYHNDGTKKIPQRQFMGNSKELTLTNSAIIKKKMKGVL